MDGLDEMGGCVGGVHDLVSGKAHYYNYYLLYFL